MQGKDDTSSPEEWVTMIRDRRGLVHGLGMVVLLKKLNGIRWCEEKGEY